MSFINRLSITYNLQLSFTVRSIRGKSKRISLICTEQTKEVQ